MAYFLTNEALLGAKIQKMDQRTVNTKAGETMTILNIKMVADKPISEKAKVFADVKMLGQSADSFVKFHKVNDKALISGPLHVEQYETKDGRKRRSYTIDANSWSFFDNDAPDINEITLQGRLVGDPEVGEKVTSFTIAVDRPGKEDVKDFVRCALFGPARELTGPKGEPLNLTQGCMIRIKGVINSNTYERTLETGETEKIYSLEVNSDTPKSVALVSRPKGTGSGSAAAPVAATSTATTPDADAKAWEELTDDIPF